jgi:predicted DNA-binding transcriptional regulator YafY
MVSITLVPTFELVAMILSYGKHIELISPQWLRQEIEEELEESVLKYKRKKHHG